jgi:hypothetical protein
MLTALSQLYLVVHKRALFAKWEHGVQLRFIYFANITVPYGLKNK